MTYYKLSDLQKLCKDNNLKFTGTKNILFQKLVDNKILEPIISENLTKPKTIKNKKQYLLKDLQKICKDNNLQVTGTKEQIIEKLKNKELLPQDFVSKEKKEDVHFTLKELQILCEKNNIDKLGSREKLLKKLQDNNIELKKKELSPIEEMLKKYNTSELKQLCKEKNLKTTGKKEDLAKRIINEKIFFIRDTIFVHPLQDNLFIHNDTQFVYDINKKLIVGKWNNKIIDLTKDDIFICKNMKLPYKIPITLLGEIIKKKRKKENLYEDDDDDDEEYLD